MKNIVISLKSAEARREHIEKEFDKQNISFEFFDALTPDLAKPIAEKMQLNVKDEYLTDGELACFMSHVSVWQKMIDEQIPYVAIFEDDIYLGEKSHDYLNCDSWLNQEWILVKLELFNNRVILENEKILIQQGEVSRSVIKLKNKHYGCAGYILTLNGAINFLKKIKEHKILIPLDHFIFNLLIKEMEGIYQLQPALCIQDSIFYGSHENMPSDLELLRRKRMKFFKKNGQEKLKLEVLRLVNQIKLKLFGTNIEFK